MIFIRAVYSSKRSLALALSLAHIVNLPLHALCSAVSLPFLRIAELLSILTNTCNTAGIEMKLSTVYFRNCHRWENLALEPVPCILFL